MKKVLYPERNFRGDGTTVAICYLDDLKDYPICTIRSYSKSYQVEVVNGKKTIIDIPYDDVELKRLNRKLLKKEKKGYLTYEQRNKIQLLIVCSIVKSRQLF